MAKKQNTIFHCWFEKVWNNSRAELIDEMIATNAIAHGLKNHMALRAIKSVGWKHSRNSITAFVARFWIFTSESKQWFSGSDLAVGYCKIKATRTCAGFCMKSSGKPVAFEGMLMFRVRDGKVVEARNSFDFLKMCQQMGVVKLAGG